MIFFPNYCVAFLNLTQLNGAHQKPNHNSSIYYFLFSCVVEYSFSIPTMKKKKKKKVEKEKEVNEVYRHICGISCCSQVRLKHQKEWGRLFRFFFWVFFFLFVFLLFSYLFLLLIVIQYKWFATRVTHVLFTRSFSWSTDLLCAIFPCF